MLALFSCKKEALNTKTNQEMDVYVAGFVSDAGSPLYDYNYPLFDPGGGDYPSYWKNGILVKLDTDRLPNNDYGYTGGRAISIAVSGNDVYVLGSGLFISSNRSTIGGISWKNGIRDYDDRAALTVLNNDVYIVEIGNPATYLKNGKPVGTLAGSTWADAATSASISGNDVYVAGTLYSINSIAKYWKNGNPVNLTDGSKDAVATSIAVSGTDVYVAGYEFNGSFNVAKYWKNGNPVNLTDGTKDAFATSIAVSGTDVYVAGTEWNADVNRSPIAKYWKNGNPVNLTNISNWAEARSIAVSGNDVYVAGFEDGVAKYWKNGIPVILGDVSKYSEAYSIFLAPK